jgi:hypothetical protein
MGKLDPVSIEDLAVAMRDAEPREVKVVGRRVIEHATVKAIIIRRDSEEVELSQPGRSSFTVDAEDIMWTRPSLLTPDVVQPWLTAADPVVPTPVEVQTEVLPQVLAGVGIVRSVPGEDLLYKRGRAHDGHAEGRYDVMRLVYEMTDHPRVGIPKLIGYESPTPMWHSLHHTKKDPQRIIDLVTLVRERAGRCWRRSTDRGDCIVE